MFIFYPVNNICVIGTEIYSKIQIFFYFVDVNFLQKKTNSNKSELGPPGNDFRGEIEVIYIPITVMV